MLKVLRRYYSAPRVLKISEKFYNKNPRNLELLRFSQTIKGWELQAPVKSYYFKCHIYQDKNDSIGVIEHISGKKLIEVSTKDSLISSNLHSNSDISAYENIGFILAQRCMHAGILAAFFDRGDYSPTSEKVAAFCKAMETGGVLLSEPEVVKPPDPIGVDYDSISEEERLRITDTKLIDNLKTTPVWNKKTKFLWNMQFKADEKKPSRQLTYEKVSKGAWWNNFYSELIHPQELPHWDEKAVCKSKPVTVDDYLPEFGIRRGQLDIDDIVDKNK